MRAVERLTGQPKIKQLYDHYRADLSRDVPFFEAAIRLLDLDVLFSAGRHALIPREGPLVVVANHPFGVLDVLIISWLISLRRGDFKVLTNSVLDALPEARPYLLPVDDEWRPFTAKLITQSGAHVTPIFFDGQNSRLFQIASHLSLELRLALVFRELRRRMGKTLRVEIGETLTPDELEAAGKRRGLMEFLREKTYALAPDGKGPRYREAGVRFQANKPKIFR